MRRFGDAPIHAFLGFQPGPRDTARAELRLPWRGEFLQEAGRLQGGLVAALADQAAVYLLAPGLDGRTLTSVEFKLNFLAPGRPGAGDLVGRAEPLRVGRTLAVCRASVWQADVCLAEGLFTYLLGERPDPPDDAPG